VDRICKHIGVVLSRSADFETGRNAYPSQARVAARAGYSKTGPVSRALDALRKDGWLYREGKGPAPKGGGRPNDKYRLTVPKHAHKHDGSALPHVES
jgi:predicted ArsR family transcriptional regulator